MNFTDRISWVKEQIRVVYPDDDVKKGFDLNRNGILEPNERVVDVNHNGYVGDRHDWVEFYKKNLATFRKIGGAFVWGSAFSPDNPIHEVIQFHNIYGNNAYVQKTYAMLTAILKATKQRLAGKTLTPQEKLKTVYSVMGSMGIKIDVSKSNPDPLFTSNMTSKYLDCDTSSFALLAIGHELGWPLYLVSVPEHVFVRWEGRAGSKVERFNIDDGAIQTDEYYKRKYHFSREAIENGTYMSNGGRAVILSLALVNRALVLERRGKDKRATSNLRLALRMCPNNITALHNLAAVYRNANRFSEARELYSDVVRLDPYSHRAYAELSVIAIQEKKFSKALSYMNQAISITDDANYYQGRAEIKKILNDLDGAIRDCDKALILKPDNVYLYLYRAELQKNHGKLKEAISDLDDAILRMPKAMKLRKARFAIKILSGDYEGAIADINEFLEIWEDNALAHFQLADILASLGKKKEALDDLNRARGLGALNHALFFQIGRVKLRMGFLKEAIEDFSSLIDLNNRNIDAFLHRGVAHFDLGNRKAALSDIESAMKLDPKHPDAILHRTLLLNFMGKLRDGLWKVHVLRNLSFKYAISHHRMARFFLLEGLFKEAIYHFDKLIQMDPIDPTYYLERGVALLKSGDADKALIDFQKVGKFFPRSVNVSYWRGMAYASLGKEHEAICEFNYAISQDSKYEEAFFARGLVKRKMGLYRDAESDFDRAIALNPKSPLYYDERGMARSNIGKLRDGKRDFDRAIALAKIPSPGYRYHRGVVNVKLGNVLAARRDLKNAFSHDASLTKARKLEKSTRYFPLLHLNLQPSYRISRGGAFEFRTGVSATWNPLTIYRNLGLGVGLEAGYAAGADSHALDAGAVLSFMNEFSRARIVLNLGIGYRAVVAGDENRAMARSGGYFKYGLASRFHVDKGFELGATIAVQHEMGNSKRFSIVPGLEVTYDLW